MFNGSQQGYGGYAPGPAAPQYPPQQGVQYPYPPQHGGYPPQQQTPLVQDVICRVASRGKFLDFRNNLIPANQADFPMLHGIGGAKYAAKSTIKVFMTDYSGTQQGGGGASTVASTNISPELPYQILAVCEENAGKPTLDIGALRANIANLLNETRLPPSADGREYVAAPLDQLSGLLRMCCGNVTAGKDFAYRQERVNTYRESNGFVPVSSLQITRSGIRNSGELSKLPWYVNIANFMARPSPQQNGTTSYIPASIQDKREVFINLSDEDMFRCMIRVTRFVEMWEQTACQNIMQNGLEMREAQRVEAKMRGVPRG